MGRFLLGALTGAASLAGAYVLVVVGLFAAHALLTGVEGAARPMRVDGAAVSAAGAQRVDVRSDAWRVQLSCRGRCDDLILPTAVQQVRATEPGGHCVICRKARWWSLPGLQGAPLQAAASR